MEPACKYNIYSFFPSIDSTIRDHNLNVKIINVFSWNLQGRELLQEILGKTGIGSQALPPLEMNDWIEDHWHNRCNGSSGDKLEEDLYVAAGSYYLLRVELFGRVLYHS